MYSANSTFALYVCVRVCTLHCIEKDVARTDRTHVFFHGENNPNITVLYDILLTHCMYNFDLGQCLFVSLSACMAALFHGGMS